MRFFSRINNKFNQSNVECDKEALNGYNQVIESILSDVNKSNTVTIDNVKCYLGDKQYYFQYQYKVSFTCENSMNNKIHFTMYFGYNLQNKNVCNFLSNSSKYEFAKKIGTCMQLA